jgi:fructan beta-fructosidase
MGDIMTSSSLYREPFRPQYHFSPTENWMNDPNGLVYAGGEFHLFFQNNPAGAVWGPMHWGHAVSTDLVNWQHLPIALAPDDKGEIYSGSTVIDLANSAGFGVGALIAVFTHNLDGTQSQSLAYSTDRGRTWTKYAGNPVLRAPNGLKDFRDPKVFWYDDAGTGHWVMLVAAGTYILFYTSHDLKHWTACGSFGHGYGSKAGVWETPDLVKLPLDDGTKTRWLLTTSALIDLPSGRGGVQYFIGQFDGQVFTSDNPKETVLWADYGADFFAAQAWNSEPNGRHIWAAWMNNWSYARKIPTSTWRGILTLPRELGLVTTSEGPRLQQQPIAELQRLRGKHWHWQNITLDHTADLLANASGETLEIIAEIQIAATTTGCFGFKVRVGNDEHTSIGYNNHTAFLFLDRTQSGQTDFSPGFPGIHFAPMRPVNGSIRLHIFVDRSSVEVFGADGLVVITDQIFPAATSLGIEIFTDDERVTLRSLDIFQLMAAKFQANPAGPADAPESR